MQEREVIVRPWPVAEQPTESQIMRFFDADNLRPYRWANRPRDVYSAHTHAFDKVIIVVQGSITFYLPELGKQVELFPGDRLDLPQGTVHNAVVGSDGVICLEAHR